MRGREMKADRIGVDTAMIGNMVILRNIVDRWEIFKGKYYEVSNNVLESLSLEILHMVEKILWLKLWCSGGRERLIWVRER
jgi:hypothetical protein